MIISLTGFMGCGKSSVGRELSRLLCCPFMDLDDVIVEREGRSIPEIFASDGETEFRRMEHEALMHILTGLRRTDKKVTGILALGGGTVMTEECRDIVREKTVCVYMKATVETLMEHLEGQTEGRPMLSGESSSGRQNGTDNSALRARIEELMERRSAVYEDTAHHIIVTDGMPVGQVGMKIRETLKF
jgi:shikimate kinase